MRRSVFVLCALGFLFLIVGSVLAVPSVRSKFLTATISNHGTIRYPDDSSQQVSDPPQVTDEQSDGKVDGTSLDLLGYGVIFASFGFFGVAFLWNRRPV